MNYELEGAIEGNVAVIITLIIGVGIAVLVMIFVGVLGGQVYSQTQNDIDSINNTAIKDDINTAVQKGFEALKQTGTYLPLVVLSVIIFIVLGLVMSLGDFGYRGSGGYRGGAL